MGLTILGKELELVDLESSVSTILLSRGGSTRNPAGWKPDSGGKVLSEGNAPVKGRLVYMGSHGTFTFFRLFWRSSEKKEIFHCRKKCLYSSVNYLNQI